jgi:hypothetical protein
MDEKADPDGDPGFLGVDERDPSQVPPGFVSSALNMVFRNKTAEPRLGVEALAWMNNNTAFPLTPLASGVLAATVFNDADDVEWIVIATATKVYAVREGWLPWKCHYRLRP